MPAQTLSWADVRDRFPAAEVLSHQDTALSRLAGRDDVSLKRIIRRVSERRAEPVTALGAVHQPECCAEDVALSVHVLQKFYVRAGSTQQLEDQVGELGFEDAPPGRLHGVDRPGKREQERPPGDASGRS